MKIEHTFENDSAAEDRNVVLLSYSVLAIFHKMYKISLEIRLMAEVVDYEKSEDKINIQNMQLSVINLIPHLSHPAEESRKQEVSAKLFQIFERQDV